MLVFDDMIADIIKNKKLNSIVTKLFVRGKKFLFNHTLKFQKMLDWILLTFLLRKLQHIAINHLSDISTKYLTNVHRKCTFEPYFFLVNDTTLVWDNPLRFRKNIFG